MTFENIKKRIASNIGYVDSDGAISTGKDITETDIGNWVNNRYLDDLVASLLTQYPEDYEKVAKGNFYKATGTIATISDTTLTSDDLTFYCGMVGDRLYNSTQENYVKIDSYTDTDEVELASEQDEWEVGDTIYVLGHEFALGSSDIADLRNIREIGVKYDSDSAYYTIAKYKDQNALMRSGSETFSETYPVWYMTTASVDDVPTTTVGIFPEPSTAVTNGLRIRYTEIPDELDDDDDVPRLPLGSHSALITGATADAFSKLLMRDLAEKWEGKYQLDKQNAIADYALTRGGGVVRTWPGRRNRQLLDRTI